MTRLNSKTFIPLLLTAAFSVACGGTPGDDTRTDSAALSNSGAPKQVQGSRGDAATSGPITVCTRYDNELPSDCNWLNVGQELFNGRTWNSLSYQGDGNVVLYSSKGHALWQSHTYHVWSTVLVMQADGNLVLYENRTPVWASHTSSPSAVSAKLVLQDDGNLVIYRTDMDYYHHVSTHAVWQTHTVGLQNH